MEGGSAEAAHAKLGWWGPVGRWRSGGQVVGIGDALPHDGGVGAAGVREPVGAGDGSIGGDETSGGVGIDDGGAGPLSQLPVGRRVVEQEEGFVALPPGFADLLMQGSFEACEIASSQRDEGDGGEGCAGGGRDGAEDQHGMVPCGQGAGDAPGAGGGAADDLADVDDLDQVHGGAVFRYFGGHLSR
ncbi:MAG: hypothetical protein C0478_10795 [Planctomyces sp.]|nr:hypothetical protein [Planctomyces sp.]